jgi:hypothetical protein
VSDLKNLYYEVDDDKLKKIIVDLIPNGSYYQYTPNDADFYIKKFNELETLSKKVLKPNNPAFKTIQKVIKGGLEFWDKKESVNEATTSWSKMMQSVRKGGSGPWSLVGIENKKVVAQKINIRDKNLLPAHFEAMRKENPKAKIHIEDAGGQVVWNEKR